MILRVFVRCTRGCAGGGFARWFQALRRSFAPLRPPLLVRVLRAGASVLPDLSREHIPGAAGVSLVKIVNRENRENRNVVESGNREPGIVVGRW